MLGWRPLLFSWLNKLPESVDEDLKEFITELFDRMVRPVTQWLRKSGVKVKSHF